MANEVDSIFDRMLDDLDRANIAPRTVQSQKWFLKQIKNLGGYTQAQLFRESKGRLRTRVYPGNMVFFSYFAKTRDKLPMYDMFPLIIMIGPAKDGFLGLNLHYLDPRTRILILRKFMKITNNKKFDERTKFLLSYQTAVAIAGNKIVGQMIKHYLYGHIRSRFIKVDADEWESAIFLPVENFVYKGRDY